ncbi:MAG: ABC transporter ATP-binding protein [Candidatus Njordarchaeia archaeon]
MNNSIVTVENLVKFYGDFQALKGLSFEVKQGEIFGLLGPNGAGKTTTLKILMGILKPDEGSVTVLGYSPVEEEYKVRSLVGYVPEEVYLYNSLTIQEFFDFVASVRQLNDSYVDWLDMLVKSFGIEEYLDFPIAALSQGTRQKVAIISSLMHKPKLLILDEPIKGLDAKSARVLKEILRIHIDNGGSVIFSTHIMDVAENICDRIGIIYNGAILATGTMDELRAKLGEEEADLEEVFLVLTKEKEEISSIVKELRRGFESAEV